MNIQTDSEGQGVICFRAESTLFVRYCFIMDAVSWVVLACCHEMNLLLLMLILYVESLCCSAEGENYTWKFSFVNVLVSESSIAIANGQKEDFNMHEETIQITWLDKNVSDQCDNRTELKVFFLLKNSKWDQWPAELCTFFLQTW